ncbi:MAG: serine hydrolase domain-containing protein [Gammaproteobacteria bacterium]|nr:hypothetical protein [Gammaproteobacteria bacterium]
MNRRSAGLLIVWFFAAILAAPILARAENPPPESLGFSAERLERVAELMQRQIDANVFPGAVTLIARDDEIVHFRAQGVMDLETRRPMQKDAVFRIMSMTKPIVAVSIMMMVEEGKVRLTDPVSRFIPDFRDLTVLAPQSAAAGGPSGGSRRSVRTVPAEREITIRDLLTHTAGFMTTDGPSSGYGVTIGPDDSLADLMPRLAAVPLDFQPGTQWAYSGQFAFDVLARVVEIASGQSFDAFVKERILDPLGMTDTFFHLPDEGHPRLAGLYRTADGTLEPVPEMPFVNGVYFSGGGGLFGTAEDYLKFARMLLNGGRLGDVRLLSRKSVDLMRSAHVPDTLPGRTPGEGYGLGMRVVTDPAARNTLVSKGTFGWSGAFNTHFFIDPEERIIGIFMTQSAFLESRWQLRDDFETAVMQALIDDGPRDGD